MKQLLKVTKGKIGVGLIAFGILGAIITQTGSEPMKLGESIFGGVVLIGIGVLLLFLAKREVDAVQRQFDCQPPNYPAGSVFVYPSSKVYHTDLYCPVNSYEEQENLLEQEAINRGLRKCKKCQRYTYPKA